MRLGSMVAVFVVTVLPVLAQAQTPTPRAAAASVSIPANVVRTRAKEHLDRAAAFVAMAREAPAAATDPVNVHRAAALAHESATAYRSASAEFAKGAYQKVTSTSLHAISLAQDAIALASAAPARTTTAGTSTARTPAMVESVSGGDVAVGAADLAPDGSPAPVVRSRYHGAGPDAPPRPANWRVLGTVPFGASALQGVQPNGAAGLGGYATTAPFGIVSPVQQPPFQPAG